MKKQFLGFLLLLLSAFDISAQIREAQKIDEFGATNCCDYRGRIDNLLSQVSNFPDSKGYVFVYEGNIETSIYDNKGKLKGRKTVAPEIGMAKDVIDYLKKHVLFRGYPSDKIVFVEAGFREKYTVELWTASNEANAPKPTPTLEKMKQRKREPKEFGFCGEI